MKIIRYCSYLVGLMLLAIVIASVVLYRYLIEPVNFPGSPITFEIKAGASFSGLALQLENQAVIRHPEWWKIYAIITSQAQRVQTGEYQIESGITPAQLLANFVKGRVVEYQLTLVEGRNFIQMMNALAGQAKLKHELSGLNPDEVMVQLGKPDEHPEGRFFPDSYRYTSSMSDRDILQGAFVKMEKVLAEEWSRRAVSLPYGNAYDALIMASIVERETGIPEEREEIAGVFIRRLQKHMKLQTDPAVIYGLGSEFSGNLTRQHLQTDTPYNTYTRKGLPPTPIAMPGRAAIHAALNPESGNSLYFVAKGDGSHFFSDTLEQHIAAVRKYQVKQRATEYRSSPH